MNFLKTGILATTFCIASAAMAQEIQFGAHGGLGLPMGSLGDALDDHPGLILGGHVGLYYGNGHELRPRLDYTYYKGGYTPVGHGEYDRNKITAWGLGCDYLYYTDMRPQGLYLIGGLGYQWWTVSPNHASDSNHSGLSMALGAGFRTNRNLSLEGRFTTGQFRSNDGQANALQIIASMRF